MEDKEFVCEFTKNTVKPRQFGVYKGTTGKFGAFQMKMNPPSPDDYKPGCVFIEMTNANGPNQYDWKNSIVFKLGPTDIAQLVVGLRTLKKDSKIDLIHDPGAGTNNKGKVFKTFTVTCPKGPHSGVMVSLLEKKGKDQKKHSLGMLAHELLTFKHLLEAALVSIYGW